MDEPPVEQQNIREKRIAQLAPYQFKKGQSGNPAGRYKGVKTGKERAKQYIASLSDEEWEDFMEGLSKIDIWKMAEGLPESKSDVTTGGESLNTVLIRFIDDKGKDN